MGLDVAQVLSEAQHYSPFLCAACSALCEPNAVVTLPCSHAYCPGCLEEADTTCCTTCQTDLSCDGDEGMLVGGVRLQAWPLEEAQPLAHQCLMLVQVACMDCLKNGQPCPWTGNYGVYTQHAESEHGGRSPTGKKKSRLPPKTRPSMADLRSLSLPSITASPRPQQAQQQQQPESLLDDENNDDNEVPPPRPIMRKSSSLREFDSSDKSLSVSGLKSSDEAEAESVAESNATPSPQTLVSPRWKTNESISSQPTSEKHSPTRDAPPNLVTRQPSDNENAKNAKSRAAAYKRKPSISDDRDASNGAEQLEVSYSHALDWNNSIGSAGGWNNSFCEGAPPVMETVDEEEGEESKEFELEFEPDEEAKAEELNAAQQKKKILDKAEKLKKQANAKFNKGDFTGSRVLYTEGINVMKDIEPDSAQEHDLVSNLHSNRAVTFFREKKFQSCIEDCEKALECDATYEKSWIRKWRALMALGDFDSAFACLTTAAEMVPGSKRIQVELEKAQSEMKLITTARDHILKREFAEAKEILRPHARSSDNIGLLFVAAKADAGLGQTESALEKVNKALRFNPTHREGLELRGYALFLSGDTEKGAHLLQEAYTRDKENKETKAKLISCQNTHSGFSKGRSSVKRGRYKDAVEHFTIAIKESGDIPSRAPLFVSLRTERAEAWLLSRKYMEAMKDCQDVIDADSENATAWTLRAEVLIALGKADEAMKELSEIRRTWGWDNPTINEGYRRVDFELRVLKADDDLMAFVAELNDGKMDRLMGADSDVKRSNRRSENQSGGDKERKGRTHRTTSRNLGRGDPRSRSRSRRRRSSEDEKAGKKNDDKSATGRKATDEKTGKKSAFVPPPSIHDLTKGSDHDQKSEARSTRKKGGRRT